MLSLGQVILRERRKPIVDCRTGSFEEIVRRAHKAIRTANNRSLMFSHRGRPAMTGPEGSLQYLDEGEWRVLLSRIIHWKSHTRGGGAPWDVSHVLFVGAALTLPPSNGKVR